MTCTLEKHKENEETYQ